MTEKTKHPDTCAMYQHQGQCRLNNFRRGPDAHCTCSPSIDERHCDCHVSEIAALKKELQRCERSNVLMHMQCDGYKAQITRTTKERDELKAEQREQLEIVCGVSPITCRNGEPHEANLTECLYCRIDSLIKERDELLQLVNERNGER